jgi:hypothetical protein
MTKTIVLIAALFAASPSMLLAQTAQPAEHQTGIIDTLLEQADSIRCAVVREDVRDDKILLSECDVQQGPAK